MIQKHPLLHKLSTLMDSKFRILGISFGFDFLIGLIPFIGNLVTTGLSLLTVFYSIFIGVSWVVIFHMILNVSVDMILTAIPLLGNISDIFWKANSRNYKLLEQYANDPKSRIQRSLFASMAILGTYLGIFAIVFYALYLLTAYLISLIPL